MNLSNSASGALFLINIAVAAFAAAAPANTLPWWAIAGFAAINAVVHAIPNTGLK